MDLNETITVVSLDNGKLYKGKRIWFEMWFKDIFRDCEEISGSATLKKV